MKIIIIGANGQLGTDLVEQFSVKHEVIPLIQEDIEISDPQSVQKVLGQHQPEVVINTAAYHKVDDCENNPVKSFEINGLGAKYLATSCRELNAKLIHISTDYIFDGKQSIPYIEDDLPNPLNVYANTKLAGEYFVQQETDNYIIARVSGIYGKTRCMAKGNNFINTMLRLYREGKHLKVVTDEIVTPTWTVEISRQIAVMIEKDLRGLFHMTQEGACSWHEFASAIFEILDMNIEIEKATVKSFPAPIKRPHYSVLENKALKAADCNIMKNWKDALTEFLKQTNIEEL